MGAHRIDIPQPVMAKGRRLYERTQTPLREIAAAMRISRATLAKRIKEWGWRRSAVPAGDAAAGARPDGPLTPQCRAALAERIQQAAEREIAAIEQVLTALDRERPDDAEQTVRTLASLSRMLREVAAFNQPGETIPPHETDDDPVPRDIDEFREALAARIENFVAAGPGTEEGAVPADGSGSKPARSRRCRFRPFRA